jgi:branched-chain amino acid transport system permease protein
MLQQIANGIFQGSVYALFAVGYALVFGVLDILNLAHQAVFMVGAFTAFWLVTRGDIDISIAFLASVLFCGVLGLLLNRIAFVPLRRRRDTHFSALITSIAVGTMLEALVQGYFGAKNFRFPFGSYPEGSFTVQGVVILHLQVIVLAVALALMIGLTVLLRSTRLGSAIRAVAEHERAARLLGINVERVIAQTFFISSALGGAAGVLFGLLYSFSPTVGRQLELKGLAVIILGGMGSIPGAVVGGFLLGLTETMSVAISGTSNWRDAVAFTLLFAALLIRPNGLFGRGAVREA